MQSFPQQTIKIGVAEDHPLFIDGLKNILILNKPVEILFICSTVEELKNSDHPWRRIDFFISDLNLNNQLCLDELSIIKSQNPGLKIIALSMYQPWEIKLDVESSIFDGYVLKNSGGKILIESCKAVLKNKRYFDPNLEIQPSEPGLNKVILTSREKEIVAFLKLGKQNKEIAELLFLSEFTIKTHRQNIMRKLEVRNVAELIKKFS
jgi:DNA-binding NarL/FixJ family response regulator